jgi:hypothetical protein
LEDIRGDREVWPIIKPFFKAEFAIETDDKLILDGLANISMQRTENVLDAYKTYTSRPKAPAANHDNLYTLHNMKKYYNDAASIHVTEIMLGRSSG